MQRSVMLDQCNVHQRIDKWNRCNLKKSSQQCIDMKYLSIAAINTSITWAVTVTIAIAYDGSY